MLQRLILVALLIQFCISSPCSDPSIGASSNQQPLSDSDGDVKIMRPPTSGTYFSNPSYDCKHASQPHIYDVFSKLELHPQMLSQTINQDAKFHIIGNHPLAGQYSSLELFYVNGLWRLRKTYDDHIDELKIGVWAITGGCDEEWSIQEMHFDARSNVGKQYSVVNVWLTKWDGHRIVEVKTYVDGAVVEELLSENEIWYNSTQDTVRTEFIPGPAGMPPSRIMEILRDRSEL